MNPDTKQTKELGLHHTIKSPESKVHGANMGPTWVLSAPAGGPMLAPWTLLSGSWSVSSNIGKHVGPTFLYMAGLWSKNKMTFYKIMVVGSWPISIIASILQRYLNNGISNTVKTTSLYWNNHQGPLSI